MVSPESVRNDFYPQFVCDDPEMVRTSNVIPEPLFGRAPHISSPDDAEAARQRFDDAADKGGRQSGAFYEAQFRRFPVALGRTRRRDDEVRAVSSRCVQSILPNPDARCQNACLSGRGAGIGRMARS